MKPANIKVRPDGTVKVLDFGLAKAMEPASGSAIGVERLDDSPTITSPRDDQAGDGAGHRGLHESRAGARQVAGKRADIWAFGCVLYEMLAGRRAFEADEVADVLARVLTQQPDWTLLPPTVPAGIVRLLRRCLEKDPKRRLADIADARLDIDDALAQANGDPTQMPTGAVREAGSSGRTKVAWAVAALFAASALGLGITMMLRPVAGRCASCIAARFS